jgi:hypothetical protein
MMMQVREVGRHQKIAGISENMNTRHVFQPLSLTTHGVWDKENTTLAFAHRLLNLGYWNKSTWHITYFLARDLCNLIHNMGDCCAGAFVVHKNCDFWLGQLWFLYIIKATQTDF